ncbi:MAG: hypothetical protein K0R69_1754, partial [Clostridia bacterium]|nr:hypothetical protein [Clostridia bacterium]
ETEVKDTIPNGLTLEEDSIRLDGTPISIDNTNGPLKYNSVSGSSGGILSYVFTQTFNKPYILTYSTKVTDAEAYTSNDPKTYTNRVQLIGVDIPNNASAEIGVKADTNILKKSGIGNNTSTHEMEWQVTVNENQVIIGNPLIEDTLPGGLQYIENSFRVDGSTTTEGFAYDSSTNKFTYNFTGLTDGNNEINKKYTLTYKTKVLNNTVYAVNGNKGFENKAELTGNGIIKTTVKANKSYTSKVITKAGKGYDYSNRIADWEIVVNDNQMEMKKAYIEDSIPEGQILVTDSVSINGNAAIKAENSNGEGYYYDEATNKLRYNFSDSIQAKQIIRFQTEVTDLSIFKENGDKTLTNKVKLYGEDIPASNTEATATQTIKSVIVSKEGRYEKGDSFIDWEVVINKNELPITNPVLRDVLQEGLELDTATVQLFELVIGKDGKYTVSDEVPLTSEHIQYTSASREFKFYFNEDITKAYLLKFQTDIASTHNNATFRNSIDFTGSHGDEENSSGDIKVAVYTSGGEASAKNGNVTIMKEDGDTGDKLSGAEFEIIDRLGIKLGDSKVTNNEGKLIFDKLKFGIPYTVKEVKAPEGYYIKEDGIRTLILSNENKAITYTAENFKIKGSIIFKKIDEQGSPIQGAVFELFKEGELNRVIQTITSSEQGVVSFEKVPYGRYIIKEKKPAQGYLAASTQLKAAVTKHDEEVYAAPEGNSDTLFALENVSIKGTLNVIKVDEANENIKLSGAVFKLFKVKGSDESYITELTTANNGQVELPNLAYGDYILREIQAPKGYYINTEDHSFSIAEADTTILVTIKDKRIPIGSLVINKLDAWYGTPLEGVKFEIYNQVGERIKTESTDNKGRIEIKGLLVGTYTVKEIDTPTGYHTVNIEKTAEVKLDVSTELTIENHPLRTLVIKKTAKNNPSKVLEGAVFEISKSDATMTKEISTDTKGLAESRDLSFGIYHIKEVKAPVGYQLLKEPLVITIDEATPPIYQIEIENLQASSGGGGGGTTPTTPEEPIEPEQPIAPEQPTPPIIEEKTPEETPVEGTIEGPEDSKAEVGEKPAHGTVTIDENGKWTYTPEPGFIGKDKFTIKIIHDDGTEEELLIEIDVEEIPLGTINLSKEDEPTEKLPKTGEGRSFGIQFLGLVLIGAGWGIKRKRAKVQNI